MNLIRETLIPFLTPVRKLAKEKEAIGTYLSGAGPTVMVLSSKENASSIVDYLKEQLPSKLGNYEIRVINCRSIRRFELKKDNR